MATKGFFSSKLNILGILTVAAGLAELANILPEPLGKYAIVISGCATVILRTFFTGTRVEIGAKS